MRVFALIQRGQVSQHRSSRDSPVNLPHLRYLSLHVKHDTTPHSPSAIGLTIGSILSGLVASPILSLCIKFVDNDVSVSSDALEVLFCQRTQTLQRLSFINCILTNDALEVICKSCICLKLLELPIPCRKLVGDEIYALSNGNLNVTENRMLSLVLLIYLPRLIPCSIPPPARSLGHNSP
jgi:hypothetical protein